MTQFLYNSLILTLFVVFASGRLSAFQEGTKDLPVLPGTKIVEGDNQNEFYVIAADDTETLQAILRKTELKKMKNSIKTSETTKIELALNDVLERAVAKHHNFNPRFHYAKQQKKDRKPGKNILAYNAKKRMNIDVAS